MEILGIDIGGSGIKGAPVNINRGRLTGERHRIPTPQPSTPKAVAKVVAQVAAHFDWKGPIGCTFPAVVQNGIVYSAANVDKSWVNVNGKRMFQKATGCPVLLINDGDAAGIAEMTYGAGKGRTDVVFMLAFGTGIGTAVFTKGVLLPNTELAHLEIRGKDAERRASSGARERKNMSWEEWAVHVNEYLGHLERLFSPDLFIIGGGVSKKHRRFFPLLKTQAEIVPARFLNQAGIIGAAMAAKDLVMPK